MVAGELPPTPTQLSPGTGPVTIDGNVIQANLANDDGGGIRLLQTSGSHVSRTNPGTISITNNTIANNVSAHEGGGIALDDAAFVNIVDNTVTKNLTTATAVTSNGDAAPAGLSTAANSDLLQARLRNGALFPGSATLAGDAVQQADAARQRVRRQPRRQLQRRLRLRHRGHAARRHGKRA